jgi:hypothetical protein
VVDFPERAGREADPEALIDVVPAPRRQGRTALALATGPVEAFPVSAGSEAAAVARLIVVARP